MRSFIGAITLSAILLTLFTGCAAANLPGEVVEKTTVTTSAKEDPADPNAVVSIKMTYDGDLNDREEDFFEDDYNFYLFPSEMSNYVIVTFASGREMKIKDALNAGLVRISDLDRFNISYITKSKSELASNPDIVRIYVPEDAGDDIVEEFYSDGERVYYFNASISDSVHVEFKDGSEMDIKNALEKGLVKITDLDIWHIGYGSYPIEDETE